MYRHVRGLIAALTLLVVVVLPSGARGEFAIKDGDRVVFWGDSITDNAFYTRTIENYVRGRYPRMKVDFWNLGWGGDAASTKRIERDLPPLDPTLVLINLGMNDGGYAPFDENRAAKYLGGIENLISVIHSKTKARIIMSTPITYETGVRSDEQAKKLDSFYPETLRKMSERLIAFGAEKGIPVIDLNAGYAAALTKYKAADPTVKLSGDAVHPNAAGNALMAYLLLQGLGADGDILHLAIDAQAGKVAASANQSVSDFAKSEGGFSFVRQVSAFPFRTSGGGSLPDNATWQDTLNRNQLQISGLSAPYYALYMGDEQHPLSVFSKDELERGVNLNEGDLGLPEDAIASLIAANVEDMHAARYGRWRRVLLKGVGSPYVSPPFLPETSESLLLAARANMTSAFLSSDRIFCAPYTLKFVAVDRPEFAVKGPVQSVLALDDGQRSLVAGTFAVNGEVQASTARQMKTYRLGYTYNNTWWASLGMRISDPQTPGTLDISGYSAVQLAYRGLEGSQRLALVFSSGEGKSTNVDAAGAADAWTFVEIPMERIRTGTLDPAKLSAITIAVTGTPSGKGELAVKCIRFIKR